jgi:hypothetical protein
LNDTVLRSVLPAALLMTCVAIFFFITLGYGYDNDTYLMLKTWQRMLVEGTYVPSRFQGSIIPEFIIGFSASLGGHILSNSLSFAGLIVFAFTLAYILSSDGINKEKIILIVIGTIVNPYWILAASTSMDYIYAAAFFTLGVRFLTKAQPVAAALLLAMAGGSRISYAPLGLLILIICWYRSREYRMLYMQALITYMCVGTLLYLPAFIHAKLSLSFLNVAAPDYQGVFGLLARALHKSINLFGYVGMLVVLSTGLFLVFCNRLVLTRNLKHRPAIFCLLIIGYHLLLFVRLPIEVSYLLPCVPAVMILLIYCGAEPRHFILIIAAQIAYWFVAIDPVKIIHADTGACGPVIATDTRIDPHLAPGVLVAAARDTVKLEPCNRRLLLPNSVLSSTPLPLKGLGEWHYYSSVNMPDTSRGKF